MSTTSSGAVSTRSTSSGDARCRSCGSHPRIAAVDRLRIAVEPPSRVTRSEVVALASARRSDDSDTNAAAAGSPDAAPPPRDGLILVAEDNETNRKVIRLQLQLLGYRAEIAVDGRDALQRWRRGHFVLLLSDLQMPEMDGYGLTAAIRAEEPAGQRLPIIALTANLMRAEELRCRAVGMDSFLIKPVRLPQLKAAIEGWLGGPVDAEPEGDSTERTAPADLAVLTELVGDDPDVIADLVRAFCADARRASDALGLAVAAGSTQDAVNTAHRLKAAARTLGAHRLVQICDAIEESADSAFGQPLGELLDRFVAEVDAVRRHLDAVSRDGR